MRTASGVELLASRPADDAGAVPAGSAYATFDPEAALLFDRVTEALIARETGRGA